MFRRSFRSLVCLLLVASLLGSSVCLAESDSGLFSRLKAKVEGKVEQAKTKNFWIKEIWTRSASFLTGKAAGFVGFAICGTLGLMVGGPVAAGIAGLIGYRVGAEIAKAFVKPVVQALVDQKLNKEKLSIKAATAGLNAKALTAEGLGSAAGDLVGEVIGVTAGVALLGGMGPLALPFLGVVTGSLLGRKVGEKLGRYFGRKLGKKAGVALAGGEPRVASPTAPITAAPKAQKPAATDPFAVSKARYQQAYQAYADAMADSRCDEATRKKLFQQYQDAYRQFQTLTSPK